MSIEESTIETLQNRIKYLETNLHLALQVLNEMEIDALELQNSNLQNLDSRTQAQVTNLASISPVELPTFLNSRTWKHDIEMVEFNDFCDRAIA